MGEERWRRGGGKVEERWRRGGGEVEENSKVSSTIASFKTTSIFPIEKKHNVRKIIVALSI